jgi:hypothetical protein
MHEPMSSAGHQILAKGLPPGTTVRIRNEPKVIHGAVHADDGQYLWYEYFLGDGWLTTEIEHDDVLLSTWTRRPVGSADFAFDDPRAEGVRLVEIARGQADFRAFGEFGAGIVPGDLGRLEYVEYGAPGPRAAVERFAPDTPWLLGTGTDLATRDFALA